MLNQISSWENLRSFGSSKLFASSSIFLFLVPVTAKLLAEVPERVTLPFSVEPIVLNIGLPFSWVLLFATSLLVVLANLLFRFTCPTIVRSFAGASEFQSAGRSAADLRRFIWEILPESVRQKANDANAQAYDSGNDIVVTYILRLLSLNLAHEDYSSPLLKCLSMGPNANGQEATLSRGFAIVRDASSLVSPFYRFVVTALFFTSFAFITWIIVANMCFVVKFVMIHGF